MQEGTHIATKKRAAATGDKNRRPANKSLKIPLQGVFIVLLSVILFLIWLGCMVVVAKLIFG